MKVKDMKQLDKKLRKQLKDNGVKYFFPVQAEVIPWLLETHKQADIVFPRDVCISAPTGSGKTLAFVLPVIQALMNCTVRVIRALVILPTQDLANQVFKSFKLYTQNTNLKVTLITGSNSFANEQKQLVAESKISNLFFIRFINLCSIVLDEAFGYMSKVDILVCTAGRLVDHIKETKGFSLHHLEYLIIDEADRVLETIQNDWLYHLEKHIYHDGMLLISFNISYIPIVRITVLYLQFIQCESEFSVILIVYRYRNACSKNIKCISIKETETATEIIIFRNVITRS